MAQKETAINSEWYQSVWLPFAAATYIIICVFDFMIMPIYTAAHNSRIEAKVFVELEGRDVATFADTLVKANQAQRQWNPLTLLGAGMFHLSFGALLTGGAVTRGMAKKTEIEGYYRYGSAGYENYSDENAPYVPNRSGQGPMYDNRYRNNRNDDRYDDRNGPMPRTNDDGG